MDIEGRIKELESILDQLQDQVDHPGDEMEDLYVYICMLLASDKLENNIKQSTSQKIEELKEYYKEIRKRTSI